MTDYDRALFTLSTVKSRDDAFGWWRDNPAAVRGTTLIVSHEEPSNLAVPVRRRFGTKLCLLSIFAYENLTVLNDRIFAETAQCGTSTFGVDYNIAFDANAASFLRSAFDQRDNPQVTDLRQFLHHFGGNRMNWDVRPYLHEHADSLISNDRHIYETVLASERLAALDMRAFMNSGLLTTNIEMDDLHSRASIEMSDFCRNLSDGGKELIHHRQRSFYAMLLYMTILQRSRPRKRDAIPKLKAMIQFMDEDISALFLMLLWTAWLWFTADPRMRIFSPLQKSAKRPLERAANISWDIYHMTEQHGMVMTSRKGADVLVPAFLTADQDLGELWQAYPIQSCWTPGGLRHPYCAPAIDVGRKFSRLLGNDSTFVARYLSLEAHQRRVHRLTAGSPPSITELIRRLESKLCS
ncbi:MAG TPA: hypothetical protein VM940_09120 [Chthoniobacterales bacterium]|jgi:hypothetical protein|nr:hypothetical protein [Chthoniobacterales bacterium]